MANKFNTYDLLGIFVPGILILGWLPVCFPSLVTTGAMAAFPDAFKVILLTATAVFVGQLVQAVASLLEPLLYKSWGGRPSDTALDEGLDGYLPEESAFRIKNKLFAAVGEAREKQSLFLYAMQLADGQDCGRAGRFNSLYAYHRALLVLALVCTLALGVSMLWGGAVVWTNTQKAWVGVGVLVLLALIWHRSWQRACYYVREVLLTAERVLDDQKREKE